MWTKTDRFVREYHMLSPGDRLVLGLSGGADSVCLARYLLSLREREDICLAALHVNHGLRGEESDEDEAFVRAFCHHFQIPLETVRVDVAGEAGRLGRSLEETGRMARYHHLRQYAAANQCRRIAVAHHQKDQAETLLLNQIRGTGFRGLAGMRPVHNDIIRPFLTLSREEILKILEKLGQDYREDSSNASVEYRRNYIRHRLLPAMEEVNAGAEGHLASLAFRMGDLADYLDPLLDRVWGEMAVENYAGRQPADKEGNPLSILIKIEVVDRSRFERMEMIRRAAARMTGSGKDLTSAHYEMIEKLLYNKNGKMNRLPGGISVVRISRGLLFYYSEEEEELLERTGLCLSGKDRSFRNHTETPGRHISGGESVEAGRYRQAGLSGESRTWGEAGEAEEEVLPLPDPVNRHIYFQGQMICANLYYLERGEEDCVKTDCEICLDYDKIKGSLTFRYRKSGDYFICDRAGHRKLLKRYFIDRKIPAGKRNTCLLLAEGPHILWMETGRVSEHYKAGDDTKHILAIRMK